MQTLHQDHPQDSNARGKIDAGEICRAIKQSILGQPAEVMLQLPEVALHAVGGGVTVVATGGVVLIGDMVLMGDMV